jgi:hypothetical protein
MPIFIESQEFASPEAYTAFCLDRAKCLTQAQKRSLFVEKLKKRATFGLGTILQNTDMLLYYEIFHKD